MTGYGSNQLELPFALWGREARRGLVRARFGVTRALPTRNVRSGRPAGVREPSFRRYPPLRHLIPTLRHELMT
jgi:hypothetical protein